MRQRASETLGSASSAELSSTAHALRVVSSPPSLAEPSLIELDISRCEEVCALEPRCYSHPWSSELIRTEFEKDISFRPALVLDGKIAAYSFNYIVADELHILNLAVAPDMRKRGLGSTLLSEILMGGIRRGVTFALLEVRQSNEVAQRLYESFGFKLIGMRRHYYRDNQEHALVLERKLESVDLEEVASLVRAPRLRP